MTFLEDDAAPEPARTIYERARAAETVRALGGRVCDWCRVPMAGRDTHPDCYAAWLREFNREAEESVKIFGANMGAAQTTIKLEGTFNGKTRKVVVRSPPKKGKG